MIEKYISYFLHYKLAGISAVITLLPLILIGYRKAYIDPSIRLLLIFLLSKLVVDFIMFHYAVKRMNNVLFLNITIMVRYVLLSLMFHSKFETKRYKNLLYPASAAFILFTLWDIFYCNPVILNFHEHRMVMYALTVESFLIIFWILLYFYELLRSLKIPNLLTFPFFWICSGLLLLYSSLIFISPALHFVFQWDKKMDIGFLDHIPYIFETVCMILFSIGICFFSKNYYARH
jgi:hypothetical protein